MARAKQQVARVFHALGDPTRRAIIERLSAGPVSVSQLAVPLGVTLTAVTQHLRVLEESALARTEKQGRVRTCRIERKGFSMLQQWIDVQRTLWKTRLDRLDDLLDEEN